VATATLVGVEDYLALPRKEGLAYEYDEGRVIEAPAQSLENAEIQMIVGEALRAAVRRAGLGYIVAGPTGFWLTPQLERIPDVCVLARERAATMEVFHGSRRGAPDLAVEIISPTDSAAEVERKIDQYLAAGVKAVLVLYPDSRHVRLCRPGGEVRRLGAADAVELAELAPGLQIPVAELFPPRS
jgi:Uma2 family endonuclease